MARCMGGQPVQSRGAVAAALCTALRCLEAAAARKSVASLLDRQVRLDSRRLRYTTMSAWDAD